MTNVFLIAASGISFLIGFLSILAGSKVVMGHKMNYRVVPWLPVFNLIIGVISAFFTAPILWQGNAISIPLTLSTLVGNGIVLVILRTSFNDEVATESLRAMVFRVAVWIIILVLLAVESLLIGAF